jgi:hypothetical protein
MKQRRSQWRQQRHLAKEKIMNTKNDTGTAKQRFKLLRSDLQVQAGGTSRVELSEEELKQACGAAVDAYIGSATGGAGAGRRGQA